MKDLNVSDNSKMHDKLPLELNVTTYQNEKIEFEEDTGNVFMMN